MDTHLLNADVITGGSRTLRPEEQVEATSKGPPAAFVGALARA